MSEYETHLVKTLLSQKISFKRLFDKHRHLDDQVIEANKGGGVVDEMSLENMKKEKLLLKDQMEKMIVEFGNNQAVA